uniref:Protein apterous n=1 Tax=Timema monikensis TaxID=170555 RepID=A0A7R9E5W0_9NEOP|nr:unnamed protein product [Timema monikensis]
MGAEGVDRVSDEWVLKEWTESVMLSDTICGNLMDPPRLSECPRGAHIVARLPAHRCARCTAVCLLWFPLGGRSCMAHSSIPRWYFLAKPSYKGKHRDICEITPRRVENHLGEHYGKSNVISPSEIRTSPLCSNALVAPREVSCLLNPLHTRGGYVQQWSEWFVHPVLFIQHVIRRKRSSHQHEEEGPHGDRGGGDLFMGAQRFYCCHSNPEDVSINDCLTLGSACYLSNLEFLIVGDETYVKGHVSGPALPRTTDLQNLRLLRTYAMLSCSTSYNSSTRIYADSKGIRLFGMKRCARCQAAILSSELVMRARDLVFHVHCFTCAVCNSPLTKGDHFGMRNGAVFCRLHYEIALTEHTHPMGPNPPASKQATFPGGGAGTYLPPYPSPEFHPHHPHHHHHHHHHHPLPSPLPIQTPTPAGSEGIPPTSKVSYFNGATTGTTRQKGRPRKRKPKDLEAMTASLAHPNIEPLSERFYQPLLDQIQSCAARLGAVWRGEVGRTLRGTHVTWYARYVVRTLRGPLASSASAPKLLFYRSRGAGFNPHASRLSVKLCFCNGVKLSLNGPALLRPIYEARNVLLSAGLATVPSHAQRSLVTAWKRSDRSLASECLAWSSKRHRYRLPKNMFLHIGTYFGVSTTETNKLDLNADYLDIPFGRSGPGTPGMPGSNGQRTKRMRTSFKHHQLRTMKSYFAINHNPDAKDLKQLSQKTGLPKRVLQVWFQNARAKWRRMVLKQEGKSGGQGDKCSGPESAGSLADLEGYQQHGGSSGDYRSQGLGSPPFILGGSSPSALECS